MTLPEFAPEWGGMTDGRSLDKRVFSWSKGRIARTAPGCASEVNAISLLMVTQVIALQEPRGENLTERFLATLTLIDHGR